MDQGSNRLASEIAPPPRQCEATTPPPPDRNVPPAVSVETRLAPLEKKLDKPKDVWDKAGVIGGLLSPVLTAVAVAAFGWWLSGAVTLGLQKQQLEVSSGKEMQALILQLRARGPAEDIQAAALTLAAGFGRHAVAPLIGVLRTDGTLSAPAAEEGLRTIPFSYHAHTCDALAAALGNRSRLYSWSAHQRIIRLVGDLDCQQAKTVVADYRTLVAEALKGQPDMLDRYRGVVQPVPEVNAESLGLLQADLDRTLAHLGKSTSPR